MGLFDREESNSQDEVVVDVSEEGTEEDQRLKGEVETRLTDPKSSSPKSSDSSESADLSDIKTQNERIIELLEKLVDEEIGNESKRGKGKKNSEQEMTGGLDGVL